MGFRDKHTNLPDDTAREWGYPPTNHPHPHNPRILRAGGVRHVTNVCYMVMGDTLFHGGSTGSNPVPGITVSGDGDGFTPTFTPTFSPTRRTKSCSIRESIRSGGETTFSVRCRENGRQREQRGFPTRHEANAFAKEVIEAAEHLHMESVV